MGGATGNSKVTLDPVLSALLRSVLWGQRKQQVLHRKRRKLYFRGLAPVTLGALANPDSVGQRAGNQAGVQCCHLEAQFLLLRENSVFVLYGLQLIG